MKRYEKSPFQKARIIKDEGGVKIAIMSQRYLDSTCWSVQFWGVKYCKTCPLLRKRNCGGSCEVKKFLREERQ